MGKIKLPALISNGMVLQRDEENIIWGHCEPRKMMRLRMGAYQTAIEAGDDGYFELQVPPMKAGGPWTILLDDGEECVMLSDILFGDVFLLGGQSNMELPLERTMERYREEIENTSEKEIRMFEVPKEYLFGDKREDIEKGHWRKACGEELLFFSAAGFFAAKELYGKRRVPIGLLQTAVGGTPVKAWCAEETIKRLGLDEWELDECKQEGYIQEIEQSEAKRAEAWWKEALAGCDGRKGTVSLPGFFEGTDLQKISGAVKLKKTVWLPETIRWEAEPAKLYLGALIDADFSYINGVKVGETAYRYPPRIYSIPEGVLHGGENTLEVTLLIFNGEGAFMPGKEYSICYGDGFKENISLSGEWEYEIIKEMPVLPDTTFFIYKAAGMYQGMLYPIRKWNIKGCFFYQGESNTGRPETYEEEYTAMVEDWRALFGKKDLPMIHVQLAGFGDGREQTEGIMWAKLREAQYLASRHIKNVHMAQAYDLGEYNDLHPLDKKNVGIRIALAAEKLIYGENVICQGSTMGDVRKEGDVVQVLFDPEEAKLHAVKRGCGDACNEKMAETTVHGFALIKADGSRESVEATLVKDNVVEIVLPNTKQCVGIAYAWNDCPLDANLYNEQELPVVPFEFRW